MQEYPYVFLNDFLRYALVAGLAYWMFYVLFKKRWLHRKIQATLLQNDQIWFEMKYSFSTIIIFSLVGFSILKLQKAGYTLIYDDVSKYGYGWLLVSFVLIILLHDAYFYWAHRLMHHPSVFKHVHLVHHKSTSPSPWAAYSFHPIEAVIEAGIFPILVFIMPLHGLTLFAFTSYMIIRNVFGHLGIEVLPKGFAKNKRIGWHTTAVHHDMHHKYFNKNFGLYFRWWDKWFGTEHKDYMNQYENTTSKPKNNLKKAVILLFLTNLSALNSQSVVGLWQTYDETSGLPLSQIKIQETTNGLEGKIEKIFLLPWQGTNPECTKCSGGRKNQKVIGMNLLENFYLNETDLKQIIWKNGQVLDYESGNLYNCTIQLSSPQLAYIKGSAGPLGLFSFTMTLKKMKVSPQKHALSGQWAVYDDRFNKLRYTVNVSNSNGKLQALIEKIHLFEWEGTDPICKSCEGHMKNTKVVGMTILQRFSKETDAKWSKGQITDPANGKTYNSSIWLENANTLVVRGYWGVLYRSQKWHRVQ